MLNEEDEENISPKNSPKSMRGLFQSGDEENSTIQADEGTQITENKR